MFNRNQTLLLIFESTEYKKIIQKLTTALIKIMGPFASKGCATTVCLSVCMCVSDLCANVCCDMLGKQVWHALAKFMFHEINLNRKIFASRCNCLAKYLYIPNYNASSNLKHIYFWNNKGYS